jgi:ABC-type multidrug transport system fused ATPase/permease subunit
VIRIARELWAILTRKQRIRAMVLLVLMLAGMLLEMFGVGLVVPALAAISRPDFGSTGFAADIVAALGNPTRERLVLTGMAVLVAVYLIKTLFLAFLTARQVQFAYRAQEEVSYRLFFTYLRQPYVFHLRRNSAQLIRNAVNEIHLFSHTFLTSGLMLLAELFVLFGIIVLLFVLEPAGTAIVGGVLGVLGLGFHFLMKGPVLRWGKARQAHEGRRIQHLQEGLGGVKQVLLTNREREFLAEYHVHNVGSARVGERQQTLYQMPRLGLELLAVIGLAVLVWLKLRSGAPVESLLPTIGLFAAAGFRLIPSMSRIMNTVQNVWYAAPVVTVLKDELALGAAPLENEPAPIEFRNHVRVLGVSYTYPGASAMALNDVNVEVRHGQTVGFIGGSGSGKSTLVDIMLGLLQPAAGRIEVDGVDVAAQPRAWQKIVGYVPQSIFLTDDTLRRNIAFGVAASEIDDVAVRRAVRSAQLEEFVSSLPDGLDAMVGERGVRLSGGQLQRIGIARALYHDPPVLVLDEATSSLDSATEQGVMRAVAALHGLKTIVVVAHRLGTLANCDWIYRLENGRVVGRGEVATMIGPAALAGREGS